MSISIALLKSGIRHSEVLDYKFQRTYHLSYFTNLFLNGLLILLNHWILCGNIFRIVGAWSRLYHRKLFLIAPVIVCYCYRPNIFRYLKSNIFFSNSSFLKHSSDNVIRSSSVRYSKNLTRPTWDYSRWSPTFSYKFQHYQDLHEISIYTIFTILKIL